MTARRSAQAGFTMIELLVTMAVLALMSLLIVTLVPHLMRFQKATADLSARIEEMSRTQDFLYAALAGTLTPQTTGRGLGAVPFVGAADHIDATVRLPVGLSRGGLTRLTLTVVTHDDGQALLLSLHAIRSAGVSGQEGQSVVLLHGMKAISFAYFSAGHGWADASGDPRHIPALIRLTVDSGDRRHPWPDMVVHPLIDAGIECQFDPILAACREGT